MHGAACPAFEGNNSVTLHGEWSRVWVTIHWRIQTDANTVVPVLPVTVHRFTVMISILQSASQASALDEADLHAALGNAAAGGISPVLALIESGAVDERVFTRHLADSLGWKWMETPQPDADVAILDQHGQPLVVVKKR